MGAVAVIMLGPPDIYRYHIDSEGARSYSFSYEAVELCRSGGSFSLLQADLIRANSASRPLGDKDNEL